MPGFPVELDRYLWQRCGEQAGISGFSVTRAWEQDVRCIRESKQGDFVTKGRKGEKKDIVDNVQKYHLPPFFLPSLLTRGSHLRKKKMLTALLKYYSYTLKFNLLKCIGQWFLVYSQSCITITYI